MIWINFSDDVKKCWIMWVWDIVGKKVHITPEIHEDDTKQFIDMYIAYKI